MMPCVVNFRKRTCSTTVCSGRGSRSKVGQFYIHNVSRKFECCRPAFKVRQAVPFDNRVYASRCCTAGVTHATAQHLLVRNLMDRDDAGRFVLTDQGRAVLSGLVNP